MTCGLSPCGSFLACFGVPPVLPLSKISTASAPSPLDLILFSIPNCLGVLQQLDLTRAANQIRSHPPMSIIRNLVSDRARRIPARVLKIHERCALAMKFTCAAVTESGVRTAEAAPLRRFFIQHVGVARNFDAEFVLECYASKKIF